MKTLTIKILVLERNEEFISCLWESIEGPPLEYVDSIITEFSIVDASEDDKHKYGAAAELITIKVMSAVFDNEDGKFNFSDARGYLIEEYAGAFALKEFNVNDPSPEDKIRFNVLLPRGERRSHSCAEATK